MTPTTLPRQIPSLDSLPLPDALKTALRRLYQLVYDLRDRVLADEITPITITVTGTGIAGYRSIPFDCIILSWDVVADAVGDLRVEVIKTPSNIPDPAQKINGSIPIELVNAQFRQGGPTTGWTAQIKKHDILGFNVTSMSTITRADVSLVVSRGVR